MFLNLVPEEQETYLFSLLVNTRVQQSVLLWQTQVQPLLPEQLAERFHLVSSDLQNVTFYNRMCIIFTSQRYMFLRFISILQGVTQKDLLCCQSFIIKREGTDR